MPMPPSFWIIQQKNQLLPIHVHIDHLFAQTVAINRQKITILPNHLHIVYLFVQNIKWIQYVDTMSMPTSISILLLRF